jgi:hypothetical protein
MIHQSLTLLGTVHSDPGGFSRTRVFLERHRPDLILVEISAFGLKYRQERSSELRRTFLDSLRMVSGKMNIDFGRAVRHVRIASILRQISVPFEYRASSAYAKKTGTDLIPVDCSDFSREWIEKTWPEMISAQNIERLLELESSGPGVSSLYARAAERISLGSSLPETLTETDALRWRKREQFMAAEITSALQRFSPERPVYIGGWWHLSRGGSVKTIRELLGIEADSCRLLNRTEV